MREIRGVRQVPRDLGIRLGSSIRPVPVSTSLYEFSLEAQAFSGLRPLSSSRPPSASPLGSPAPGGPSSASPSPCRVAGVGPALRRCWGDAGISVCDVCVSSQNVHLTVDVLAQGNTYFLLIVGQLVFFTFLVVRVLAKLLDTCCWCSPSTLARNPEDRPQ